MAKTATKASSEQPEIIYSMMRVSKIYNNKPVIKDISLSYFFGAKIGVLGLNGSGKSTVLRIMAGVDHDFNGEAVLSKGYTTGILDQEPQLDPDKTVRDIVEEGAGSMLSSSEWKPPVFATTWAFIASRPSHCSVPCVPIKRHSLSQLVIWPSAHQLPRYV